jgi:excinuclease ABC subunit C
VRKKRPCLKYHIGRCVGPCTGKVGKEEYGKLVDEACMFFSGKTEKLLRDLKLRMKSLSDGMEYEKAAKIRDLITAIEKSSERQKAEFSDGRDADVLGYAKKGESAGISLIIIRGGKMLSHFFYRLGGEFRGDNVEGLSSFVKQYYSPLDDLPSEIILRDDVPDKKEIEKWLSEKSGSKVKLTVPSRGVKSDLISLAEKNAKHAVELEEARLSRPNAKDELVRVLSLSAPPKRIEGYDISNIGGAHAVGSMVVFEDSVPEKKSYRRFKIKTVPGANDPVMIREVIKRRRQHPEWSKPDLVLVDGGRAQLNTALAELSGWDVPVISLAKEEEEVYTPEKEEPIRLPKDSPALLLLMRVRDEAHRYAVSYHRTLRSRALSD